MSSYPGTQPPPPSASSDVTQLRTPGMAQQLEEAASLLRAHASVQPLLSPGAQGGALHPEHSDGVKAECGPTHGIT